MTEEKNGKSESNQPQPENKRRFNQEQYDRLIECSKKGPEGIKEWNEWRDNNRHEKIWMQGAALTNANLQGANLRFADLQGANLGRAHLQGARISYANLEGVDLNFAYLQGAKIIASIVNGSTTLLYCEIDEDTDFRHTGLENMRIESGTKYLLKYNIRRLNWKAWYKKHWLSRWPVRLFWFISKYGTSTLRVMVTFSVLAIAFAFIYFRWPGCVVANNVVGDIRGFVHALYFSVVTMTTLGFGDIAANPASWQGQVVLMVQVILGYVLLGALVTRLAVLFTSDGPAGSYTPMRKETKELLAKLKEDREKEEA